jgi:hypothetical protein
MIFNIILPQTPRPPKWPLPFRFSDVLCTFFMLFIRATCPVQLILVAFVTLIITILTIFLIIVNETRAHVRATNINLLSQNVIKNFCIFYSHGLD